MTRPTEQDAYAAELRAQINTWLIADHRNTDRTATFIDEMLTGIAKVCVMMPAEAQAGLVIILMDKMEQAQELFKEMKAKAAAAAMIARVQP